MSVIVMGPEQIADLQSLKEYAESHKFSYADILERISGKGIPPGKGKNSPFVRILPINIRVCFSIDTLIEGEFRHASISIPKEGKYLEPIAANWIIQQLGFLDKIGAGSCRAAVNEKENCLGIAEKI